MKRTDLYEAMSLDLVQIDQLNNYARLLVEWNEKMNLTAIVEPDEIWYKHFYDSLAPFKNINFTRLCDVGTGAGFPGLVLAIARPESTIVLVEPLQKRCRFLAHVVDQLALKNVVIHNGRAEDFAKEAREQFDVVTSRAVARLTILAELCAPLVKVKGLFVALKGSKANEELTNASFALSKLGLQLDQEIHVPVLEADHVSLVFEKKQKTPSQYPRAYGQIKKKPLGE